MLRRRWARTPVAIVVGKQSASAKHLCVRRGIEPRVKEITAHYAALLPLGHPAMGGAPLEVGQEVTRVFLSPTVSHRQYPIRKK